MRPTVRWFLVLAITLLATPAEAQDHGAAAEEAASTTAVSAVPDAWDLSESDRRAIRNVQEAYREGWLANDSAAVMRTFTEDVVLVPHHGVAFLSILRRDAEGRWRIALQMWTDPPNQRVAPQPADGP